MNSLEKSAPANEHLSQRGRALVAEKFEAGQPDGVPPDSRVNNPRRDGRTGQIGSPGQPASTPMPRPKFQLSPHQERHRRLCTVCHHPQRAAIEIAFLLWQSPAQIARDFGLRDRTNVYRHARAFGLLAARLPGSKSGRRELSLLTRLLRAAPLAPSLGLVLPHVLSRPARRGQNSNVRDEHNENHRNNARAENDRNNGRENAAPNVANAPLPATIPGCGDQRRPVRSHSRPSLRPMECAR